MNSERRIYGTRIEQARKLAGFTQKELAEKVGVNQSAITFYEQDKNTPSEEVAKRIADATGFLPAFFGMVPVEDFPKGSLSYRAYKSVTAREEDKAYLNAKLMYEHVKIMTRHFVLPAVRVPILREKPERAAEIARTSLGVSPDAPIANLTFTLEKNGVILLPLPIFLEKIDAFSTWVKLYDDDRPLIAESFGKSSDRARFSKAHELGHLVMHNPPRDTIAVMENEANEFASAFLMPKSVMREEFSSPLTLSSLADLKIKWRVSMMALIYRARTLKVITPRQATYLFSQMSAKGWNTQEPLIIPSEKAQLIRKLIDGLYSSPEKYSQAMGINESRAAGLALLV